MKSAAISKTVFSTNGSAETSARFKADLNAKLLKLLSKPLVSSEREMLSSLLADPAALTRLVRHAGLSMALNKALESEGAHAKHFNSQPIALLPMELTQLLMKAKPIAFGSGESYGANLELDKTQAHGRIAANAIPIMSMSQNEFGFGVAIPFAPTTSDYGYTIDYLVDENREDFNSAFFNSTRNGDPVSPNLHSANYVVLAVMGFVSAVLFVFIFAQF